MKVTRLALNIICLFCGLAASRSATADSSAPIGAMVGVSDREILIGSSIALTGQGSPRALEIHKGTEMLVARTNSAGGVHGRSLRLITYDDGYEPQKTFENTRKLIYEDKVFALYGYHGTPTLKAAMPLIEKTDFILIGPTSGAEFLRSGRHYFPVTPGFLESGRMMADFVKARGLKKVGIFFQDDAFGEEAKQGAVLELRKHGLSPISQGAYNRGSAEIEAAIKSVYASAPDVVFVLGLAEPSTEFIKRSVELGHKPIFLATPSCATPEFALAMKEMKASVYIGLVVPQPKESKTTIARQFLEEAKRNKVAPSPGVFQGYVTAAVMVEALKKSGKDLNRFKLRDAFETKMNRVDVGGIQVNFTADRTQGITEVFFHQVKDGKFVPSKLK